MSALLHVVYGQSYYTEYVTVLTYGYPSFLAVTRRGSLRIIKRIRLLVTVYVHVHHVLADNEKNEC